MSLTPGTSRDNVNSSCETELMACLQVANCPFIWLRMEYNGLIALSVGVSTCCGRTCKVAWSLTMFW